MLCNLLFWYPAFRRWFVDPLLKHLNWIEKIISVRAIRSTNFVNVIPHDDMSFRNRFRNLLKIFVSELNGREKWSCFVCSSMVSLQYLYGDSAKLLYNFNRENKKNSCWFEHESYKKCCRMGMSELKRIQYWRTWMTLWIDHFSITESQSWIEIEKILTEIRMTYSTDRLVSRKCKTKAEIRAKV